MTMEIDLADPSRDARDAVAAKGGIVELVDKIWFHKTAAAVIDADRCVRCGACIASCPSNSIGIGEDGLPTLTRMCTGCSCCWDFCPLAGLRGERLQRLWDGQPSDDGAIGPVRQAYQARARAPEARVQDGGVVTTLLTALMERGFLDATILSHKLNPFAGKTVLATTPAQIAAGAGSVYDQTLPLKELQGLPADVRAVALVGTPCQVTGLRALQLFPWRYRDLPVERVKLTVALFCSRSFHPYKLPLALAGLGADLSRVAKIDIREGQFQAMDGDGQVVFQTKVGALRQAALRGCDECGDFSGGGADIAVGNVGSPRGYTTVLIRSERGEEAWQAVADALEYEPLTDLSAVVTLEGRNRRQARRHLKRDYSADLPLWMSYSEHLQAYKDSDRAPVAPPAYRSHHYTVAC